MANASSNDALHPTGNRVPRRSYLPKRTRQVQFIPTAEALKLVSGTRIRHYRKIVRKPDMFVAQTWNLGDSSHEMTAHSGTLVSRPNATSHSVGANQIGKAHQESIQTLKPPGIFAEGSSSSLPQSSSIISGSCRGSVDREQKAGLGVGKNKGEGKASVHKRKFAHGDGLNNGKLALVAEEVCNS